MHSIPRSGRDELQQLTISHSTVAIGGGVSDFIVSPDDSYVLFSSRVLSNTGGLDHYSVNINGGGITKITAPVAPNTLGASAWQFRPCPCGGRQSDMVWGLLPTAPYNCNSAKCNNFLNEIWVNNRNGNAVRINVPTGQKAGDLVANKVVSNPTVYNDYFIYETNPGSNGASDTRILYVADWSGNNWRVSPSSQVGLTNSSAEFQRSPDVNCYGTGRYLAVKDYIQSSQYQSIYIYDFDTKAVLGGGAISGSLDQNSRCSWAGWGFKSATKFFFTCNPAGSTLTNLYVFDVSTPTVAATLVNSAYPAAAVTTTIGAYAFVGDYVVFSQSPSTSLSQVGLFSYNFKTGTLRNLYTTPVGTTFGAVGGSVVDVLGSYPTSPFSTAYGSNTAHVYFKASTAVDSSLWTAPVAGADNSATLAFSATQISSFDGAICGATETVNLCSLGSSCPCSGCGAAIRCSGWFTFTATVANSTTTLLYSAPYNAPSGSVVTFGSNADDGTTVALATVRSTGNSARLIGHGNANPDVPILIYSYRSGGVTNVYTSRANVASNTALAPSPVATGSASLVDVSPDQKWALISSATIDAARQIELFLAPTDAKAAASRLTVTSPTVNQTFGSAAISGDSKYVVYTQVDTVSVAPVSRIYSATLATPPVIVDLTPNNVGNGLASVTSFTFHCNQRTVIYKASLPSTNDPTSPFAVPVAGGSTVNLGFRSTGVTGSVVVLKSAERVGYTAAYYPASPSSFDIFANGFTVGAAAFLAPCLALLLVVAALF